MFFLRICNSQINIQGLSSTTFRIQTPESVRITFNKYYLVLVHSECTIRVSTLMWWNWGHGDSRYTVARITEEKEWIRIVEFACGLFFVVDYLIKVYRWIMMSCQVPIAQFEKCLNNPQGLFMGDMLRSLSNEWWYLIPWQDVISLLKNAIGVTWCMKVTY